MKPRTEVPPLDTSGKETLADLLAATNWLHIIGTSNAVQVFVDGINDPAIPRLFNLADYAVSSSSSGPSFWLRPRASLIARAAT